MNKGNLSSTLIVFIKADREVTQMICVFTPKSNNFSPFQNEPIMKPTLNLLFLVFAMCISNYLSAQVTNATEISLIPHHTQHDVPNALRGVNQTANSNINWTYNTEFLDEFTAINPGTMRFPGGTFANSYDWELALNDTNSLNLKKTIALADAVDAEINYVINYGTTTPEEAAELVHLLNNPDPIYAAQRQLLFDVSEPIGVKYWELGNELAAKWEWHVSWVAGGHNLWIYYQTGVAPLNMPRKTTDSLHYFGGDIWRKGWVPMAGDGMDPINSMLGTIKKATAQDVIDGEMNIDVEFGPILLGVENAIVWAVDTLIDETAIAQGCEDYPANCQQNIYDLIAAPQNLLNSTEYTVQADGTISIHPTTPFFEDQTILVEYKTHHAGAFDIRDAMKTADPTIEIGYCIDFRTTLLDSVLGFNARIKVSPPDFLIEHPYNDSTDLFLNNGYLSEIMHMVDEYIYEKFIPDEAELDITCAELEIPEIGLALTEWNIRLCGPGDCNPAYNGILGGLYTANFFSQFYQAEADSLLDIRLSNHFAGIATGFNLIHMWHFINEGVVPTAQSEATRMVNEVIGDHMLLSEEMVIENNPMSTLHRLVNYPDGPQSIIQYEAEALKIYVSDDTINNVLNLLILNNDDSLAHTIQFAIPCDRIGGVEADLEILSGDLTHEFSTDASTIQNVSDTYTFSAPMLSVSTLKIPYTPGSSCLCYADFNNDGSVGVVDLLALLSDYGCSESCDTDLNADHNIGVTDILILLTLFGGVCV